MRVKLLLIAAASLLAAAGPVSAKKTPLDAGLYTQYLLGPTQVSYSVCGTLPSGQSGCFNCCGNFDLGPFDQACAVIEGVVEQKNNVLTREIYILDKRTETMHAPVTLYIYTRTDTITDDNDVQSIALTKTVKLDLRGGAASTCSMAANDGFLFIGTDADKTAIMFDKKTNKATTFGGTTPPTTVSAITADERGYVSVVFGDESAFYLYGPDGSLLVGGGGGSELVGTHNAIRR